MLLPSSIPVTESISGSVVPLAMFWVNIDILAKKIDKDHVCRLIPELVPGWETEHQEEGNKQ